MAVPRFLLANAATSAKADFRTWRELENENSQFEQSAIRTFGLAAIDEPSYGAMNEQARTLCRAVTGSWIRDPSRESESVGENAAANPAATRDLLAELKLTDDAISKMVVGALRGDAGRKIEKCSRARCDAIAEEFGDVLPEPGTLLQRIADEFSPLPGSDSRPFETITQEVVDGFMLSIDEVGAGIRKHIQACLDQPQRISGAEIAMDEILRELDTAARSSSRSHDEVGHALSQLLARKSTGSPSVPASEGQIKLEDLREHCRQFCTLSCSQAIFRCIIDYLNRVGDVVKIVSADLLDVRTRVMRINEQFSTPVRGTAESPPPPHVLNAFDKHLQSQDTFRLADLLDAGGDPDDSSVLIDLASAFLAAKTGPVEDGQMTPALRFPEAAQPVMSNVGGGRRVLAVIPESASSDYWNRRLVGEFGDCVTFRKAADDQLSVYCEVEGVNFESVLARFMHHDPRLAEVADRVHARNDIEW